MNKVRVAIVIAVLTLLVVVGFRLKANASSPVPSLEKMLLRESDLRGKVSWAENGNLKGEDAASMASFIGLPLRNSVETGISYFTACVGGGAECTPGSIAEGLYRYRTAKDAELAMDEAMSNLSGSRLGTVSILSRHEVVREGVKGRMVKASDPAGEACWFVGRSGCTVIVVVSVGSKEFGTEKLLDAVLPVLARRVGKAR